MKINAPLAVAFATLALGACAGRAPQPVALAQVQDQHANCGALQAEILSQ